MDVFDPHSEATMGYHLFFQPQGALTEQLSGIIRQLAKEYDGPVFAPHVTLLARIPDADEDELIEKTKVLATKMQPFSLTIGELRIEDAYFRALYALLVEQDALRTLHEQASEVFGMEPSSAYRGHLSLLYGNYSVERKERTRGNLQIPTGAPFVATAIHLFKTPSSVETWRKIASVLMGV